MSLLEQQNINYFWDKLQEDENIKYLLSADYLISLRPSFNSLPLEEKFYIICVHLALQSGALNNLIWKNDITLSIDPEKAVNAVRNAIVYSLFIRLCIDNFLVKCQQSLFAVHPAVCFDDSQDSLESLWADPLQTYFYFKNTNGDTSYRIAASIKLDDMKLALTDSYMDRLPELPVRIILQKQNRTVSGGAGVGYTVPIIKLKNAFLEGLSEFYN